MARTPTKPIPTTAKAKTALLEKCAVMGYSAVAKNLRYNRGELVDFILDNHAEFQALELKVMRLIVAERRKK